MEQRDLFSADSYTEAKDLVSSSAGLCELKYDLCLSNAKEQNIADFLTPFYLISNKNINLKKMLADFSFSDIQISNIEELIKSNCGN